MDEGDHEIIDISEQMLVRIFSNQAKNKIDDLLSSEDSYEEGLTETLLTLDPRNGKVGFVHENKFHKLSRGMARLATETALKNYGFDIPNIRSHYDSNESVTFDTNQYPRLKLDIKREPIEKTEEFTTIWAARILPNHIQPLR